MELLFEADQRRTRLDRLVAERLEPHAGQPASDYAAVLVLGVAEQLAVIDEWLVTYSHGWPLDRMPAVDRALARLGAWEIVYAPDVPDQVVIGEIADLAGELSTDSSANFLSGLLGRLSEIKAGL